MEIRTARKLILIFDSADDRPTVISKLAPISKAIRESWDLLPTEYRSVSYTEKIHVNRTSILGEDFLSRWIVYPKLSVKIDSDINITDSHLKFDSEASIAADKILSYAKSVIGWLNVQSLVKFHDLAWRTAGE
jgi:hypothetical protein